MTESKSVARDPNNEFEKQGVQFKIITEEMSPQVADFMWKNFFPDEPISRSVKLTRHESIDKYYILDSIKHKASIAALNQAGDILAVRLGTIYSSGDRGEKFFQNLMTWVFSFKAVSKRLPEPLQGMHHALKFTKMADYNVWNMFDKLGTDKIYEAKGVCSARSHGIRGLGTELVRRSEILAVERGCTHVYAALTGMYSQRLFAGLNHITITSVEYADYKDPSGQPYLNDTREHKKFVVCYKKIA